MRFNGRATTDAQELAALVAADGSTGGFLKDSDYVEGLWTPAIAFDTPGNSSIILSTAFGAYTKIRNLVEATFGIVTSTFSHSTASGNLNITGLPFTSTNTTDLFGVGPMQFAGITKANYTQLIPRVAPNATSAIILASGSGQTSVVVTFADMPTGGSVILRGKIIYRAA